MRDMPALLRRAWRHDTPWPWAALAHEYMALGGLASRYSLTDPAPRHGRVVSTGVYGHPRATVASPPRPDKAAAAAAYSASCLRRLLPLSPRATLTAGRAAAARLPRPRRHLHRPGHPHGLRLHLVPLFCCRSEAEARGFPSRAGF